MIKHFQSILTVAFHKGCSEGDIAVGRPWGEVREQIDFHFPLEEVGDHAQEDTGAAYLQQRQQKSLKI